MFFDIGGEVSWPRPLNPAIMMGYSSMGAPRRREWQPCRPAAPGADKDELAWTVLDMHVFSSVVFGSPLPTLPTCG